MKDYRNILIVRTDRIGDVILTTPAIKALRQAFPQARISILVSPATVELVEGNPYLDEVLVDDRANAHKGLSGFWKLVWFLRRKKFDCAIIFHTKKRTNALCFLAGISQRIGYQNNKWGFLLTEKIRDTRPSGAKHEAEYCLDVLKHIGVPIDEKNFPAGQLFLPLKAEAQKWVEEWLHQNKISGTEEWVAVHPGASGQEKQWPVKNFVQVIEHLRSRYPCRVVLLGAENTRPFAQEIQTFLNNSLLDLTGKTTVSQLASLLKRCRMLISNDSGPVHVADAVGTPVVSIFTRNEPGINPERWRPLSGRGKVVAPEKMAKGAQAAVSVSQVIEAVDAVFKLC